MLENIAKLLLSHGISSLSIDKDGRPTNIEYLKGEIVTENTNSTITVNPFTEKPSKDEDPRDDPDMWDDGERPSFESV